MKDSDYCEIKDLQHTLFYHAFHLHDEGELSPPGFSSEFLLCREIFSFLSVAFHCSLRALRHLLCDFPMNLFLQPQGQVMLLSNTLCSQDTSHNAQWPCILSASVWLFVISASRETLFLSLWNFKLYTEWYICAYKMFNQHLWNEIIVWKLSRSKLCHLMI